MTAPVGSLASQIEAQHQLDQAAIEAICSRPSNRLARTTLRTSRLLDFASEKELVTQTGHQKDAWPVVILKELVDNALDAAEEAGTHPVVKVTVDHTVSRSRITAPASQPT